MGVIHGPNVGGHHVADAVGLGGQTKAVLAQFVILAGRLPNIRDVVVDEFVSASDRHATDLVIGLGFTFGGRGSKCSDVVFDVNF